jgi:hypothetical protein
LRLRDAFLVVASLVGQTRFVEGDKSLKCLQVWRVARGAE